MIKFEFIWLMIFAHYIGDYVLQSIPLAITKGKERYSMLVHCVLYSGCIVWAIPTRYNTFPYLGLICLLVSHWLIDSWKCRKLEKVNKKWDTKLWEKRYLYIDQILHFIVLAGLIIWYS